MVGRQASGRTAGRVGDLPAVGAGVGQLIGLLAAWWQNTYATLLANFAVCQASSPKFPEALAVVGQFQERVRAPKVPSNVQVKK